MTEKNTFFRFFYSYFKIKCRLNLKRSCRRFNIWSFVYSRTGSYCLQYYIMCQNERDASERQQGARKKLNQLNGTIGRLSLVAAHTKNVKAKQGQLCSNLSAFKCKRNVKLKGCCGCVQIQSFLLHKDRSIHWITK